MEEDEAEDVGEDNNHGDDNLDDVGDEDAGEDGLGGHAKMVAFHAAIKAVLNRQLEKMGQEVDNLSELETLTIQTQGAEHQQVGQHGQRGV